MLFIYINEIDLIEFLNNTGFTNYQMIVVIIKYKKLSNLDVKNKHYRKLRGHN